MSFYVELNVEYPKEPLTDDEPFQLDGGLIELETEEADLLFALASSSGMTAADYVEHAIQYATDNGIVFKRYEQFRPILQRA